MQRLLLHMAPTQLCNQSAASACCDVFESGHVSVDAALTKFSTPLEKFFQAEQRV
jgi:hypothetical protein